MKGSLSHSAWLQPPAAAQGRTMSPTVAQPWDMAKSQKLRGEDALGSSSGLGKPVLRLWKTCARQDMQQAGARQRPAVTVSPLHLTVTTLSCATGSSPTEVTAQGEGVLPAAGGDPTMLPVPGVRSCKEASKPMGDAPSQGFFPEAVQRSHQHPGRGRRLQHQTLETGQEALSSLLSGCDDGSSLVICGTDR